MTKFLLTLFFTVNANAQSINNIDYKSLILTEKSDLQQKEGLSQEQIKADLDMLSILFDEIYEAKYLLSNEEFNKHLEKIKAIQTENIKTSKDLCLAIADATKELKDEHFTVRIKNPAPEKGWKICNVTTPRVGKVGKNVWADQTDKPWGIIEKTVKGKKVPIIAIASNSLNYTLPVWNGFQQAVEKIYQDDPAAIIIDLRGNSGGGTYWPERAARILYGLPAEPSSLWPTPHPGMTTHMNQLPHAYAMFSNYVFMSQILPFIEAGKEVPKEALDFRQTWFDDADRAAKGEMPPQATVTTEEVQLPSTKYFNKPIYILVDRRTASSSELTLNYFEKHPKVKTIGENTWGALHFGMVSPAQLPNSKVLVILPIWVFKYKDGRYTEVIGTTPNVSVPEGSDALDKALELLAKEI